MLLVDGNVGEYKFLGERLTAAGIDPQRLELMGKRSHSEYLALYNRIDICLDPFPFNGDNTTCDGLWCGVPLITLAGDHFVSRRGVSHLTAIGLEQYIAKSPESYVEMAITLAASPAHLSQLRRSMRERILASPLCDAREFTRKVETAYREMWSRWIEGRAREPWANEVE